MSNAFTIELVFFSGRPPLPTFPFFPLCRFLGFPCPRWGRRHQKNTFRRLVFFLPAHVTRLPHPFPLPPPFRVPPPLLLVRCGLFFLILVFPGCLEGFGSLVLPPTKNHGNVVSAAFPSFFYSRLLSLLVSSFSLGVLSFPHSTGRVVHSAQQPSGVSRFTSVFGFATRRAGSGNLGCSLCGSKARPPPASESHCSPSGLGSTFFKLCAWPSAGSRSPAEGSGTFIQILFFGLVSSLPFS